MRDATLLRAVFLIAALGWLTQASRLSAQSDPATAFDPTDPKSIQLYLQSMVPASEEDVGKMIEQIGSEDFATRQKAMIDLVRVVGTMRGFLEKQRDETGDPEVRKGLGRVLATESKLSGQFIGQAAQAVFDFRHLGLALDLMRVIPLAADPKTGDQRTVDRICTAARVTIADDDRADLVKMLGAEHGATRAAALSVLRAFGDDLRDEARAHLTDKDPTVQLMAAEIFAEQSDPSCLPIFAELAAGEDFYRRWKAAGMLRQITGGEIDIDPLSRLADAPDLGKWTGARDWAAPTKPKPIALFDLKAGLDGWIKGSLNNFDARETSVIDDFVRLNGTGRCMYSHPLEFQNYKLRLEWRFPQGGVFCDSGVSFGKFDGAAERPYLDWERGKGIEVQVRPGESGMIIVCEEPLTVRGHEYRGHANVGSIPRDIDFERSGWNQLEVEERDGHISVWINGVLCNYASGRSRELTAMALRNEGYTVDFRNMTLEPLPGAKTSNDLKDEEEGEFETDEKLAAPKK